jgi:hypothetical protein
MKPRVWKEVDVKGGEDLVREGGMSVGDFDGFGCVKGEGRFEGRARGMGR